MPVADSFRGTLTRVAAGGSSLLGSLSVIGYSDYPLLGTLSVDRTLFLSYNERVRLTRPDVYISGEWMPHLVDTVKLNWSLDDPIVYAEFTLSDKRSAFFDAASLSNGALPVAVDLLAGPPGAVLTWENAFIGATETCQNSMPYRPRGVFKAVSDASLWADRQGCLNVPAMSGLTRGKLLAAFAETAGVGIENAAQIGGGLVTKAIDISGKTPFQLIQEWGEIEGWFARATEDGTGLDIVFEDRMLDGAPVYSFDESNTFDVPEQTPDRPVTDWVLSTTRMGLSDSSILGKLVTTTEGLAYTEGISLDSATVTEITTLSGVEIKRVVTQYGRVVLPATSLQPLNYQMVSRVTTENEWAMMPVMTPDFIGLTPSTQLLKRTTTTETLSGIPVASGTGSVWIQGGEWSAAWATILPTQIITETFAYDTSYGGDPCFATSDTITTEEYYSPLQDAGAGGYLYADGSYRYDTFYRFQEISKIDTKWSGKIDQNIIATWKWSGSPTETYAAAYTTGNAVAPTGSASIPQFSQQVIQVEVDATDASGYPKVTQSQVVDFAESTDELEAIGTRRIRRACADTLAIPHNALPYLRVGDHVAVTNHARSLVAADAYVVAIERTFAVLNGKARQLTTVKIPQDWAA